MRLFEGDCCVPTGGVLVSDLKLWNKVGRAKPTTVIDYTTYVCTRIVFPSQMPPSVVLASGPSSHVYEDAKGLTCTEMLAE